MGGGRADRAKPDLACKLTAPARVAAGQPVEITFTLTNRSAAAVSILRWYTPLEGVRGDIFRVTRGGRAVEYEGPLVKRGDPREADYVTIGPHASVSGSVDLAAGYDVSEPGRYRVAFTRGLADVVREQKGARAPRPRDAHRAVRLSCPSVTVAITSR